jgi:hypothetical protein
LRVRVREGVDRQDATHVRAGGEAVRAHGWELRVGRAGSRIDRELDGPRIYMSG